MGRLCVMDGSGDKSLEFSSKVRGSLKIAKERFDELVGERNYMAFERTDEGEAGTQQTTTFNPEAEEIVVFRRLQGG